MADRIEAEIARQEGTEFRAVRLVVEADGGVRLEAQDMGPLVESIWNDSDYEFTVRVKPASLPKLAFELLREKFAGQLGAVDAFREWCKSHDVEHEFDSQA